MQLILITWLALAFVAVGKDANSPTVIQSIPMLSNVLSMFNENDTISGVYRFPTPLKFKATDLGFPRSRIRFRFRPLEPLKKATVIIGGCVKGNPNTIVKKTEVYTRTTPFTIPDNPGNDCSRWASVFFQGKVILCGGNRTDVTPCFSTTPNADSWQQFVDLQEARSQFEMAATPNYIGLVGSNTEQNNALVLKNQTWKSFRIFPRRTRFRSHAMVGLENDEIYVLGGFTNGRGTTKVLIIDLESETTRDGPPLLQRVYSHSATAFQMDGETYIVVAGGQRYKVASRVEILKVRDSTGNYVDSQWEELPNMQQARFDFSLGVLGTQLAVFGGRPTSKTQRIEVFDTEKKAWEYTGEQIEVKGRRDPAFASFVYD